MRLYNTLTARLEPFEPSGDEVTMYVCGVTPYDEAHIGHGMSYVIFDVVRRYLEFRGYRVRHVQNFTDIDDKIIRRAQERGEEWDALARRYSERYLEEMALLNVTPAHVYPRATEEIPKIIEVIAGLIERGYAYAAGGDVYYRVTRKADYGKLSHQSVESVIAGERIEPGEGKEHPADFALWKGAKPGEPSWESPWGPGRPGWHIECSAMSLRYLGEQLDLHGGGNDLIFPHHENEIAQSEAFTGVTPFVRTWLHNGELQAEGVKMSKSLGNMVSIRDVVSRHGADAFRLFVLSAGYRKPLNYTEEGMAGNRRGAERLRAAARRPGAVSPKSKVQSPTSGDSQALDVGRWALDSSYRERFIGAMDDDLNTAQALAVLFELATEINRARDAGDEITEAQATLLELAGVLGLRLEESAMEVVAAAPFIDLLVEVRRELRAAKQFGIADSIRARLGELGVTLEDSASGTEWRVE